MAKAGQRCKKYVSMHACIYNVPQARHSEHQRRTCCQHTGISKWEEYARMSSTACCCHGVQHGAVVDSALYKNSPELVGILMLSPSTSLKFRAGEKFRASPALPRGPTPESRLPCQGVELDSVYLTHSCASDKALRFPSSRPSTSDTKPTQQPQHCTLGL